MKVCAHIRDQVTFYLDGELQGAEQSTFETHLASCEPCRKSTADERIFLEGLHDLRPLVTAPPDLRLAVTGILESVPAVVMAPKRLRRRLKAAFSETGSTGRFRIGKRAISLALVGLFFIVALSAYWVSWRRSINTSRPSELASMAVESHLRRLRGQLPLEVVSDSPEEISSWFRDKVSFSLTLPNYQKASGQEQLYYLEGARLVALKSDYAACVAYRMRGRPITLVVTSNSVALPAGGERIVSKGLTFHYDAISGLKVITWADRGLTYALVSDLEERGQQSCIVCHEGTKDRDFLEGFKPSAPKI